VKRVLLEDRIVLLQLDPLSSVFPVLGGIVPAHTGLAGGFVLGTLKNYLDPVLIPCHNN
jgi:hypothetical protein